MMARMADSEAVRSRRKRRHAAGDHSICRHGPVALPLRVVAPGEAEGLDVAAAMRELAVRLAAAYEAQPANALLARELRATLLALAGLPAAGEGEVDPLDELRAMMGPSLTP
jgi:hypothetical protein